MSGKRISLVLGSGGARGLAHIGVIDCLRQRGYEIRYIAGSSMGALVGGIYAAGKLDVYAGWVRQFHRSDVLRLLDWSFSHGAIFKGDRIISAMKDLLGEHNIEDLPIGFTAVATDLTNEREVWLNHGPLFDAIRASMAMPLVFAPVRRQDRLLVDGALMNPVPIAPTLNDDTELTAVVNLNGPAEHLPQLPQAAVVTGHAGKNYRAAITAFIDSLLPNHREDGHPEPPGALDLLVQSIEAMQTQITRFKLAGYSPRVVIEIPRNLCGFFDFHLAGELMEFGRRRAEEVLDRAGL